MRTILLAFRVFFRTLFDAGLRKRVELLLTGPLPADEPALREKPAEPKKGAPKRSDALTLLSALQREARLIDFLHEPITGYSDAQIGAAVRDIHRDAATVLQRLFGIRPLVAESEGAQIEVPAGFDAARYCLTGNVSGQPPFRGTLCHHGWEATRCDLPAWTGGEDSARVLAAAVVELR